MNRSIIADEVVAREWQNMQGMNKSKRQYEWT